MLTDGVLPRHHVAKRHATRVDAPYAKAAWSFSVAPRPDLSFESW